MSYFNILTNNLVFNFSYILNNSNNFKKIQKISIEFSPLESVLIPSNLNIMLWCLSFKLYVIMSDLVWKHVVSRDVTFWIFLVFLILILEAYQRACFRIYSIKINKKIQGKTKFIFLKLLILARKILILWIYSLCFAPIEIKIKIFSINYQKFKWN